MTGLLLEVNTLLVRHLDGKKLMETDIQTDMQTSKVKRAIYKLILFFSVYFVVSKIFCCLSVTISNRFASMPICTLFKITPLASYSICIFLWQSSPWTNPLRDHGPCGDGDEVGLDGHGLREVESLFAIG